METIVLILVTCVLVLVAAIFWKSRNTGLNKDRLEALLNSKFIDFSERIHRTMDQTRKEVENSKDFLSKNAIDTLKNLSDMNVTVNDLLKQQDKAQKLGQSLEYLLQTPKLRGDYGEIVLEEMLEKVLPKGMWERQYSLDSKEKVDAVVKYKDVVVPIDSKFPKDDYQRYLSASSEEEKRSHWSKYEKALKIQINSIREKYIKPENGTSEFALLFIPSESIYYETIAEKNFLGDPCQIYEYATDKKVIPVSPNTFYAFLHVVLLGIRNIEIVKDAKKLQEALSKMERDFGLFYNNYENIGKSLEKAVKAYGSGDTQIRRFKNKLDNTLSMEDRFRVEGGKGLPEK